MNVGIFDFRLMNVGIFDFHESPQGVAATYSCILSDDRNLGSKYAAHRCKWHVNFFSRDTYVVLRLSQAYGVSSFPDTSGYLHFPHFPIRILGYYVFY